MMESTIKEEDIMLKKVWKFIKKNVTVIITIITALLTFVYASLRLCIYVYWSGYFKRLNINVSLMNLDFDRTIMGVVFISIILLIVAFFLNWVYEILIDIKKKQKEHNLRGIKKVISLIKAVIGAIIQSFIVLSLINTPLTMLLTSVIQIEVSAVRTIVLLLLLYTTEMLYVFMEMMTTKKNVEKEKTIEQNIASKIIGILVIAIIMLAALYYNGAHEIDKKTNVQLVENENYMISYCDGERYVLHKVEYDGEDIIIYKNKQKIVSIEECEIDIKEVKEIIIED